MIRVELCSYGIIIYMHEFSQRENVLFVTGFPKPSHVCHCIPSVVHRTWASTGLRCHRVLINFCDLLWYHRHGNKGLEKLPNKGRVQFPDSDPPHRASANWLLW